MLKCAVFHNDEVFKTMNIYGHAFLAFCARLSNGRAWSPFPAKIGQKKKGVSARFRKTGSDRHP